MYMINCKRYLKTDTTLPSQYIGQTGRTLRERFGEHTGEEYRITQMNPSQSILTSPTIPLMTSN